MEKCERSRLGTVVNVNKIVQRRNIKKIEVVEEVYRKVCAFRQFGSQESKLSTSGYL
jgi:hypothetical protein